MFEQKCILYPSLTFLAQTKLLVEAFCGHGQNILFQLRNINIVFSKSKGLYFFWLEVGMILSIHSFSWWRPLLPLQLKKKKWLLKSAVKI